jgi:hypothetical protein
MRCLTVAFLVITTLLLVAISIVLADTPRMINYQGYLTDDGGQAVTGTRQMVFRIYDAAEDGNLLWSSAQASINVQDGYFSYLIGRDSSLPATCFEEADRWLGIQVIPDPEITPRTRLSSVPYSYEALHAITVEFFNPGVSNVDSGYYNLISGDTNTIINNYCAVTGGVGNSINIQNLGDTIAPDTLDGSGTFALRGSNEDSRPWPSYCAGVHCICTGEASAVLWGVRNEVEAAFSTIGGGFHNMIPWNGTDESYSAILSGHENLVNNRLSTITGGHANVADDILNFVGTGYQDTAYDRFNVIVGGVRNQTGLSDGNPWASAYATIVNGGECLATGYVSFIGNAHHSAVHGMFSFLGGGAWDTVWSDRSFVGAGKLNFIGTNSEDPSLSQYSAIVGGFDNQITNGQGSCIGGGYYNTVEGEYSVVGGGSDNHATNSMATVGGGNLNVASGHISTVGGGWSNEASNHGATVGGGDDNTASGDRATVAGGIGNQATGIRSSIGGGYLNTSSGYAAAIPGGSENTIAATADLSMAFGNQVYVDSAYRVVFFDGSDHGRLGINRDDEDGGILYPVHVGTNTNNGNGAHLTAGGTWVDGSSRSFKENLESLDGRQLLEKVAALPVQAWNYKGTDERHIGPMAEDFVAAFDVGTTSEVDGRRIDRYLAARDVAGVALIGVQELYRMVRAQETIANELEETKTELAENRQLISELRRELASTLSLVESLMAQQATSRGKNELAMNERP